jgi:hypothetical protein
MTSRKKPAEINLPSPGSGAFQNIERDLSKFVWGPAHDADCGACAPGDVTVRATGLTKDINVKSGPQRLRIVAVVQNWSGHNVKNDATGYTFKAKTKYLMWVQVLQGETKTSWGFIELGSAYSPKPKPIGELVSCNHSHQRASVEDDANFQECTDPYPIASSSSWIKQAYAAPRTKGNHAPETAASIPKKPWISCDPDCCTGLTTLALAR